MASNCLVTISAGRTGFVGLKSESFSLSPDAARATSGLWHISFGAFSSLSCSSLSRLPYSETKIPADQNAQRHLLHYFLLSAPPHPPAESSFHAVDCTSNSKRPSTHQSKAISILILAQTGLYKTRFSWPPNPPVSSFPSFPPVL